MFTADRVAGAGLGLIALGVLIESRVLPLGSLRTPGPAYMPVVLALLLLGFGILVIAFGSRDRGEGNAGWGDWRHAVAILGACAAAALALERVGYRLTIVGVLMFLLAVVERKGLVLAALFAVALAFGSFFLFSSVLKVPLPRGPLGI